MTRIYVYAKHTIGYQIWLAHKNKYQDRGAECRISVFLAKFVPCGKRTLKHLPGQDQSINSQYATTCFWGLTIVTSISFNTVMCI